jgi:hypothetical protein
MAGALSESMVEYALRKQTGEPVKNASFLDRTKDVGVDAMRAVVGAGESAVGLVDFLNPVSTLFPKLSLGSSLSKIGYDPKATHEILSDLYSDERQAEQRDVSEAFDESFWGGMGEAFSNPATVAGTVVQSIPSMLIGRGLGGVAGKASALVKASPWLQAGLGEGLVTAGSTMEQLRQEKGETDLGDRGYAALAGGLTGLLGGVSNKLGGKLGIGDIDAPTPQEVLLKGARKSGARRFAEGALMEGFVEELPQSMQEQVIMNVATDKPWSEGLSEAAGMGALSGMAMGGPMGAYQQKLQLNEAAREQAHQELLSETEQRLAAEEVKQETGLAQGTASQSLLTEAPTIDELATGQTVLALRGQTAEKQQEIEHQAAQNEALITEEEIQQQEADPIHHPIAQAIGIETPLFRQAVSQIYTAAKNFGEFSKQLVQQFGEAVKQYAVKLWTAYKGSKLAEQRGSFSLKPTGDPVVDEHLTAQRDNKVSKLIDRAFGEIEEGTTTPATLTSLREAYQGLPEGELKAELLEMGRQYAERSKQAAPAQTTEAKGINISTRAGDPLGRALTNPTWGSKKDGKNYFDVETAYKANASRKKAPQLNADEALHYDMNLMYGLQVEKFKRHPELVEEITQRGGVDFLKASEHTVGVKGSRWEGKGEQSNFIRVLVKAYEAALKESSAAAKEAAPATDPLTEKTAYLDDLRQTVNQPKETALAVEEDYSNPEGALQTLYEKIRKTPGRQRSSDNYWKLKAQREVTARDGEELISAESVPFAQRNEEQKGLGQKNQWKDKEKSPPADFWLDFAFSLKEPPADKQSSPAPSKAGQKRLLTLQQHYNGLLPTLRKAYQSASPENQARIAALGQRLQQQLAPTATAPLQEQVVSDDYGSVEELMAAMAKVLPEHKRPLNKEERDHKQLMEQITGVHLSEEQRKSLFRERAQQLKDAAKQEKDRESIADRGKAKTVRRIEYLQNRRESLTNELTTLETVKADLGDNSGIEMKLDAVAEELQSVEDELAKTQEEIYAGQLAQEERWLDQGEAAAQEEFYDGSEEEGDDAFSGVAKPRKLKPIDNLDANPKKGVGGLDADELTPGVDPDRARFDYLRRPSDDLEQDLAADDPTQQKALSDAFEQMMANPELATAAEGEQSPAAFIANILDSLKERYDIDLVVKALLAKEKITTLRKLKPGLPQFLSDLLEYDERLPDIDEYDLTAKEEVEVNQLFNEEIRAEEAVLSQVDPKVLENATKGLQTVTSLEKLASNNPTLKRALARSRQEVRRLSKAQAREKQYGLFRSATQSYLDGKELRQADVSQATINRLAAQNIVPFLDALYTLANEGLKKKAHILDIGRVLNTMRRNTLATDDFRYLDKAANKTRPTDDPTQGLVVRQLLRNFMVQAGWDEKSAWSDEQVAEALPENLEALNNGRPAPDSGDITMFMSKAAWDIRNTEPLINIYGSMNQDGRRHDTSKVLWVRTKRPNGTWSEPMPMNELDVVAMEEKNLPIQRTGRELAPGAVTQLFAWTQDNTRRNLWGEAIERNLLLNGAPVTEEMFKANEALHERISELQEKNKTRTAQEDGELKTAERQAQTMDIAIKAGLWNRQFKAAKILDNDYFEKLAKAAKYKPLQKTAAELYELFQQHGADPVAFKSVLTQQLLDHRQEELTGFHHRALQALDKASRNDKEAVAAAAQKEVRTFLLQKLGKELGGLYEQKYDQGQAVTLDAVQTRTVEAARVYELQALRALDQTIKQERSADYRKKAATADDRKVEKVLSLATEKYLRSLEVEISDYFVPKAQLDSFEQELQSQHPYLTVGQFSLNNLTPILLNEQSLFEQMLNKVASLFGADLVLVNAPGYRSRYVGKATDGRSKIILNARVGKVDLARVFAHEVFHHVLNKLTKGEFLAFRNSLQHMIANPGLYRGELANRFIQDTYLSGMNEDGPNLRSITLLNQAIAATAVKEGISREQAEQEVMSELFADVATSKAFYEHLAKTLPGRTLAAKLILRLLPQLTTFFEFSSKANGFSFEKDLLLQKSDMNSIYSLFAETLGFSLEPGRDVRYAGEQFQTAVQSGQALSGKIWKAIFPTGSISRKQFMTSIEKFAKLVFDKFKEIRPKFIHADLWASPEETKLAYKAAHAGTYLKDQLSRKLEKYRRTFHGWTPEQLEKLNDDFARGVTAERSTDLKVLTAYDKHMTALLRARADGKLTEWQFNKKSKQAYEKTMVRTQDPIDVGTPVRPNASGIAKAKALGYSDEVIEVFQQYKEQADIMYTALRKIYPDLPHNATHYGQSIRWFSKNGIVLDDSYDWAVNPEYSKLEGNKRFLKNRDMERTTREIAEEYQIEAQTLNPHDLFLRYMHDAQRLITLHEVLQEGMSKKLIKGFHGENRETKAAKEGYVPVNDNVFKILAKLDLPETFRIQLAGGDYLQQQNREAVYGTHEEASQALNQGLQEDPATFSMATIETGKGLSQQHTAQWRVLLVTPQGDRLPHQQTFQTERQANEFATQKQQETGIPHYAERELATADTAQIGQFYMRKDLANMLNILLGKDHIRNGTFMGISGNQVMNVKNMQTSVEFAVSMFHLMTIGQEMVSSEAGHVLQRYKGSERVKRFINAFRPGKTFGKANQLVTLLTAVIADESLATDPAVIQKANELLGTSSVDLLDLVKTYYDGVGGMLGQDESLRSSVHGYGKMRYTSKEDKLNVVNGEVQFERGIVSDLSLKAMMDSGGEVFDNEMAKSGKKWKAVSKTTLFGLMQAPSAFLMEYGIPRVKMAMWAQEYTLELDRQKDAIAAGSKTKDEIARDVMFFIEDRFGEVNWKNMWMKPTAKTALQFLFRSFTWMAGSWVALGKAGYDLGKLGWFTIKGEQYQLTTKGYWGVTALMSHMLTVGLVSTAYLAIGAAGGEDEVPDDEETPLLTKMLFPRVSRDDPQGRITVPSYITELYKIMRHLGLIGDNQELSKLVTGRFNSLVGKTIEVINGEDWRGVSITAHDDGFVTRAAKQAAHIALVMPISLSTVARSIQKKGFSGGAAIGLAGFTDAPASAKRSDAANKAFEIRRQEYKGRRIDPEDMEESETIRRAVYQYAQGDPSAVKELRAAGKLSTRQFQNALQKQPRINGKRNPRYKDPLSSALKGLTITGAMETWQYMTDTEKRKHKTTLRKKFYNVQRRNDRSPQEKDLIRKKMKELQIL